MKPLVIYHDNCADGFGAAFAAWLTLGDEAEYVACRYGEEFTYITEIAASNCEVYILDFSFPRDVMDLIFKHSKRVVWLDHHKTAFEMWLGYDHQKEGWFVDNNAPHYICLDHHNSGALLAWKFFHPDFDVPLFIKHIDDYDRWQFKVEGTKVFNKALWSYAPWTFEQWRDWFYDVEDGFGHTYWSDFYHEGEAILRAHDQNVQSVVKGAARGCVIKLPAHQLYDDDDSYKPKSILDRNGEVVLGLCKVCGRAECELDDDCEIAGLAANCPPHLTSDVGHELATKSGTFGLCWTLSQEGLVAKCSLRSNGDYDVSAIAKTFGGGGHRNAAGFEVDIQTLLSWL